VDAAKSSREIDNFKGNFLHIFLHPQNPYFQIFSYPNTPYINGKLIYSVMYNLNSNSFYGPGSYNTSSINHYVFIVLVSFDSL